MIAHAAPRVSVLMPVHNACATENHESYLHQAIRSILYQTFDAWELVIVDDGSTDATSDVLDGYAKEDSRIRVIRQEPNMGVASALNTGIAECRAPLIARQDADDISTVTRLELQLQYMNERPDLAMCGTGMYVIDEQGRLKMIINDRPTEYEEIRRALYEWGCVFVHGSVMFRKEAVQQLGGYTTDPSFQRAEDYELWVRMAAHFRIENIPNAVYYFHRDHPMKMSIKTEDMVARDTERVRALARGLLGGNN